MTRSIENSHGSSSTATQISDEQLPVATIAADNHGDDFLVSGAGIDLPLSPSNGLIGGNRDPSGVDQAWWTVGEYYPEGSRVTHQSARFSLTGGRVFGPGQKEEVWDLSDSLAELYEHSKSASQGKHMHKNQVSELEVKDWLAKGSSHGFIRVYPPDTSYHRNSQLVPCTLSTTAHKVCLVLGLTPNTLHIQLNGDKVRRLDPYEHPLVLQNDYLTRLGYTDISRMQEEGLSEDLGYLVKFYAGKPHFDSTFARTQMQSFLNIKRDKVMATWSKKLCILSGTRLLICKDKSKSSEQWILQLAKGSVEEAHMVKGHSHVLKLTSTLDNEKVLVSFLDTETYNKWFRKLKKATDKLPTAADLSNCQLEFLPENVFINDQLAMLNLRHNVLKERPLEEDIYTIGWLDDLPRFNFLRSLNLADNNLVQFPLALCQISTLVELNLASNKLEEIPAQIRQLSNLQALHIHNNHLTNLPWELADLSRMFILVLAFNRFTEIPRPLADMTNIRISELENVILAGNSIRSVTSDVLKRMQYAKKVDLRMNNLRFPLQETVHLGLLEHLTHLDLRDNAVEELDLRPIKTLEYLNCERNGMIELQLNGMALKNLFAAQNDLEKFNISPKPEWLLQLDLSFNCLTSLPDWLGECFFLQRLNVSHNVLSSLPPKLFSDSKKLKSLRANHNYLLELPSEVENLAFEELHLHHNQLTRLPNDLLRKANKLRVLNLSRNRLFMLPQANEVRDLNKLQELYLTSNSLGDSVFGVISCYCRLKILHVGHNEIHNLFDSEISQLEVLQELNISGNQLRSLPDALGHLPHLVILRAHSNSLQNLPDFKEATALRILDVGHNQLLNISMANVMASQLDLLDMSLNTQLKVDPKEFKSIKQQKSVCLVDSSGQNKVLPGLHRRRGHITDQEEDDHNLPWKVGFSETSGIRNKLCVATLRILKFEHETQSLFGIFDGGHNNEVPKMLLDKLPSITREEQKKDPVHYMKYTMLTAHKKLGATGQKLGASVALCHLRCHAQTSIGATAGSSEHAGSGSVYGSTRSNVASEAERIRHFELDLCNVGDVEIVLCRHGEAVCLTHKHVTTEDHEECERVCETDGIITEDNKVNGTTKNTRLLGNSYLFPQVVPDPFSLSISLRHDDEFLIIANRGLWRYLTYHEAVEEVYEIGNPVLAAKRLQDLAQAYGSKENLAVLVVRLNTDHGPSLARLRIHKSMSIDDMEAAQEFEERRRRQQLLQERQHSIIAMPNRKRSQSTDPSKPERRKRVSVATPEAQCASGSPIQSGSTIQSAFASRQSRITSQERATASPQLAQNSAKLPRQSQPSPKPEHLKPLPNQRYRKKDVSTEWEAILQQRLSQDVKDKELKQLSRTVSKDSRLSSDGSQISRLISNVNSDVDSTSTLASSQLSGNIALNSKKLTSHRITMPPPVKDSSGHCNPSRLYTSISDETDLSAEQGKSDIKPTHSHSESPAERKTKFRNTLALFENLHKESDSPPVQSPKPKREAPPPPPQAGLQKDKQKTTVVFIKRDERARKFPASEMVSGENVKVEVQTVEVSMNSSDNMSSNSTFKGSGGSISKATTAATVQENKTEDHLRFVEISHL